MTEPLTRNAQPKSSYLLRAVALTDHFFHVSVQEITEDQYGPVTEQVGVYDPFPNENNEKLACLNFNRIQHWLDEGAIMSISVKRLLGLSGYLPVLPSTYKAAWMKRKLLLKTIEELEA